MANDVDPWAPVGSPTDSSNVDPWSPANNKGEPNPISWSDVAHGAWSNLPSSAGELAKNIAQPFIHPIETATGIKNVGLGALEKAGITSGTEHIPYADAIGEFYKNRFGGMENIKHTLAEDPVGAAADLATVLTGGGGMAARAPGLVGKVGEIAGTIGSAIDPIANAARVAKPVARVAGEGISHGLGLTTGAGAESIKQAAEAGYKGGQAAEDFQQNLRKTAPMPDVVQDAKDAVSELRRQRGDNYKNSITGLKANQAIYGGIWADIANSITDASKIGTFKGKDLYPSTRNVRQKIFDDVSDWYREYRNDPGSFGTLESFDALKKKVGDIRDNTVFGTPERKVADTVYHAIRKAIVRADPEYGRVMEGYEKATQTIREIEDTLTLKPNARIDTSLRKLQSILRNNVNTNYGRRAELAQFLIDAGAPNLMKKLSGQTLSSWTPRGLQGAGLAGELGYLIMTHGLTPASIPGAVGAAAIASPRLVGEGAYYAGKASKYSPSRNVLRALNQIGRLPLGDEDKGFAKGGAVNRKEKIKRDAFLYMDSNNPHFAECSKCSLYKKGVCTILAMRVQPEWSCGAFLKGPYGGQEVKKITTPEEVGLVKHKVRCENCVYSAGNTCKLYEMLNKDMPDKFALDTKIKPHACCNAQTPIEDKNRADGGRVTSSHFHDANEALGFNKQEGDLYKRHLENLWGSGGVTNPDGSRSTLYQAVVEHNGRYYNIPTVRNGKILPIPYAEQAAHDEGIEKFPSYSTPEEADARYDQMHGFMERDTGDYFNAQGHAIGGRVGFADGGDPELSPEDQQLAATMTHQAFQPNPAQPVIDAKPLSDSDMAQSAAEAAAARVRAPYVRATSHPYPTPDKFNIDYNKLTGSGGEERYQLWPERIARGAGSALNAGIDFIESLDPVEIAKGIYHSAVSGATAPRDAFTGKLQVTDPETGMPSKEAIERAMDITQLTMTGGMPASEVGALGMAGGRLGKQITTLGGPPTYSAAGAAARAAKAQSMQPSQWFGYLKNQPGVKAQELEHVGLEPWLNSKSGQVSKQELHDFIQSKQPQITEVRKGQPDWEAIEKLDKEHSSLLREPNPNNNRIRELEDQINKLTNDTPIYNRDDLKLPGGENYGETLLTLPRASDELFKKAWKDRTGVDISNITPQQLHNIRSNSVADTVVGDYRSTHWSEPNVLLHVRHNDRVIPEKGYYVQNTKSGHVSPTFATKAEAEAYQSKLPPNMLLPENTKIMEGNNRPTKSLHLEEVQSDWHQAGRKSGYIEGYPGEVIDPGAVPDAPFKTTWPDLALKRMLHRAATEKNPDGSYKYDSLSWTPGQANADRYDLSKQVNKLSLGATNNPNKPYNLIGYDKSGRTVGSWDLDSKDELVRTIGDEPAKKLLNKAGPDFKHGDSNVEIGSQELKFGGEGMKAFYDKMLVDKANALTKKYGTRVQQKFIEENKTNTKAKYGQNPNYTEKHPIWHLPITKELRNAAEGGFPTFAHGGGVLGYEDGGDVEPLSDSDMAQSAAEASAARVRAPYVRSTDQPHSIYNKLTGSHGEERYQLWPEKLVRGAGSALNAGIDYIENLDPTEIAKEMYHSAISGATAPRDAFTGKLQVTDPETGMPSKEAIERARDITQLAMTGGMPASEAGALGMAGGKLGKQTTTRTEEAGLLGRRELPGSEGQLEAPRVADKEISPVHTETPLEGLPAVNEGRADITPTPPGVNKLTVNDILHPDYPTLPARSRNVTDIAEELQNRGRVALKEMGLPEKIEKTNPQSDEVLSHAMASEIEAAMSRSGKNASEWYTAKIQRAMELASQLHPEIATDPNMAMAYRAALAITSQGEKVTSNVRLANMAYETYKKTGQFPTNVAAKKGKSINNNLRILNSLINNMGPEGTRNFLSQEFTVRELKDMGYNIKEGLNQKVNGSAIFGPKIGQGFYQNLSGNYDPVTMDLWFMRAWGRLTGTLKGKNPKVSAKQRERFVNELNEEGIPVPNSDEALLQKADDLVAKHEKHFFANREKYDSEEFTKSDLTKAAERYAFGFRGLNEAPSSGGQRAWMRSVVNRARELLAERGLNVTNADLQAIWWYPEKELYGKLGGRDAEAINVDYADALTDLLEKGKTNEEGGIHALENGPGRGSTVNEPGGGRGSSKKGKRTNEEEGTSLPKVRAYGGAVNEGMYRNYADGGDPNYDPTLDDAYQAQQAREVAAGRLRQQVQPEEGRENSGQLGEAMLDALAPGYSAQKAFRQGNYGEALSDIAPYAVPGAGSVIKALAPAARPLIRGAGAFLAGTGVGAGGAFLNGESEAGEELTPLQKTLIAKTPRDKRPELLKQFAAESAQRQAEQERVGREKEARAQADAEARKKLQSEIESLPEEERAMYAGFNPEQRATYWAHKAEEKRRADEQALEDARAKEHESLPFLQRFPTIAKYLPAVASSAAAAIPYAIRLRQAAVANKYLREWENTASSAEHALRTGNMDEAAIHVNKLKQYNTEHEAVLNKINKGVHPAALTSSASIPFDLEFLTPNSIDALTLPPGNPAHDKAIEELTTPSEYASRAGSALVQGAVPALTSTKIPIPGRITPPTAASMGHVATFDQRAAERAAEVAEQARLAANAAKNETRRQNMIAKAKAEALRSQATNPGWNTPSPKRTRKTKSTEEPGRAYGGRIMSHYIDHNPSEAQKKAGNYRKGHVNFHGLEIALENAKGSTRSGVDKNGKTWKSTLPAHYGYVKGSTGRDGDHIDTYLGPHHASKKIFVINQKDADTKRFDEHKAFIGFGSEPQVKSTFMKAFSDGKGKERLGHITEMTIPEFKTFLEAESGENASS